MAGEDCPAVTHEAEIVCAAHPQNLGVLLEFMERACRQASLPDDIAFAMRLATEEACTNVIMHSYAGRPPGDLSLRFARDDARVVVTIDDHGHPFMPSSVPAPGLFAPAEERALGGLGWHLIQQMMDEVTHEYDAERGNRLTLIKYLAAATAQEETTWKSL